MSIENLQYLQGGCIFNQDTEQVPHIVSSNLTDTFYMTAKPHIERVQSNLKNSFNKVEEVTTDKELFHSRASSAGGRLVVRLEKVSHCDIYIQWDRALIACLYPVIVSNSWTCAALCIQPAT